MSGTLQTVLIVVGILALAALVWVLVEAALTVRGARATIKNLEERLEPTLAHVEQLTESLQPTVDKLDPLVERVQLTVDSLNLELMQVDKILSDASDITGTASGAVQKMSDVANAPTQIATTAANKLRDTFSKKKVEKRVDRAIEGGQEPDTSIVLESSSAGDVSEASRIVSEWAKESSDKYRAAKAAEAAEAEEAAEAAEEAAGAEAAADDADVEEPESTPPFPRPAAAFPKSE